MVSSFISLSCKNIMVSSFSSLSCKNDANSRWQIDPRCDPATCLWIQLYKSFIDVSLPCSIIYIVHSFFILDMIFCIYMYSRHFSILFLAFLCEMHQNFKKMNAAILSNIPHIKCSNSRQRLVGPLSEQCDRVDIISICLRCTMLAMNCIILIWPEMCWKHSRSLGISSGDKTFVEYTQKNQDDGCGGHLGWPSQKLKKQVWSYSCPGSIDEVWWCQIQS